MSSLLTALFLALAAWPCEIVKTNGQPANDLNDPFYRTVSTLRACPETAPALRTVLESAGARVQPAMVANRGFHNPELGSFSFFESVTGVAKPGDFFFGHFTRKTERGEIELDQSPEPGKLLIELLVRDDSKGYYNFYELIGTETGGRWFYRGDSADVLADTRFLHLDPPAGSPKFGARLRCSGCHSSGGPIMKELAFPHNDWWRTLRPLPLGSGTPSTEVANWMSRLIDAGEFAMNVKTGIDSLEASASYRALKSKRTLKEKLRPLFCEQEINLESDHGQTADVVVPSAFLSSPLLPPSKTLVMARSEYTRRVMNAKLQFPETNLPDADHTWLTPVKGYSDLIAIRSLIEDGVVNRTYAESVLKVDSSNPVISKTRCDLLGAAREGSLPIIPTLSSVSEDPFEKLLRLRKAVRTSEISQNPRGQILEPGFRVIFPEPRAK